ncbi:unnamed protein product, partial [Discosporangium mesarthrocarpum]
MLYVPTGFPHTTDTVTRIELEESGEAASPSVHLTMGVDSHIWGLNYAALRSFFLARSGARDPILAGG